MKHFKIQGHASLREEMKAVVGKTFFGLTLIASLIPPQNSYAQSNYSQTALRGAKSAQYAFTEVSDPRCAFQPNTEQQAQPMLDEIEKMGLRRVTVISQEDLPDISILILSETGSREIDGYGVTCSTLVKVEAIHTMVAKLRYWDGSDVIRARVYFETSFGTSTPANVDAEIKATALHMIARFGYVYSSVSQVTRP